MLNGHGRLKKGTSYGYATVYVLWTSDDNWRPIALVSNCLQTFADMDDGNHTMA